MQLLFVGHRGTGKTTVAKLVAELLGRRFVDLDEAIAEREGRSCAELVAKEPRRFRKLEIEALARAMRDDTVVISAGAGIEEIAPEPLTIWLERDGWEETAREERARLRPELEWADEVDWMRSTREPRWQRAAHLHYRVPRGRTSQRAADDIAALVRMALSMHDVAEKSWMTPSAADDFGRAVRDAARFGLAGVEVRSDVFSAWRDADVPRLAALRSRDSEWLAAALADADALDIDIDLLPFFREHGGFDAPPRRLILSRHPSGVDPDDVDELVRVGRYVQTDHPDWAKHVVLKYAPTCESLAELGLARATFAPIQRAGVATTFLPQGFEHGWYRPIAARTNTTNYIAVGIRPSRYDGDAELKTPWDLQDWIPHLAAPVPAGYDALIGVAAHKSQGDLWHRRAAIERGESWGYLKVDAWRRDFESALELLHDLGIRGISVTSPYKKEVSFVQTNDADFGPRLDAEESEEARRAKFPVRIGNTLVRHGKGWLATDTDRFGMLASLKWFEERETGPATVALFGQGGVSAAVVEALEQSDWFLVAHIGAREGWGEERPTFVTLVVNAAGNWPDVHDNPPKCRAWLDLHYRDVSAPPEGVLHLNGDVFFDAQAQAQRAFWSDLYEGE